MPVWLIGVLTNKYVLAALTVTGLILGAWWWHTSKVNAAVDAERTRLEAVIESERSAQREKISGWVVEMVEREAKAAARYAKLAAERHEIFITLEKEVPVYVTSLADSRCIIPRGFVLHHDAAAAARTPADPGAAGGLVDADSGIALSTVAGTVSENYAACHDAFDEVRRWREWYADFRAQWALLRKSIQEEK